jgi:hypothetical protein
MTNFLESGIDASVVAHFERLRLVEPATLGATTETAAALRAR